MNSLKLEKFSFREAIPHAIISVTAADTHRQGELLTIDHQNDLISPHVQVKDTLNLS